MVRSRTVILSVAAAAGSIESMAWFGGVMTTHVPTTSRLPRHADDLDDKFAKSKVGEGKQRDQAWLDAEDEDARFWRQKLKEDKLKGVKAKVLTKGKAVWKGTRSTTEQSSRGRKTNLAALKKAAMRADVGYFSPLVEITRNIVGEDKLVEMRKAWIQHHTKVISAGVLFAADKNLGRAIAKQLFAAADVDHSGQLDKGEVFAAVHKAGFSWMTRRKVESLMGNADNDMNNMIDYDEFEEIAPSTLRKSFAKLASVRGRWLGLLG